MYRATNHYKHIQSITTTQMVFFSIRYTPCIYVFFEIFFENVHKANITHFHYAAIHT